MGSIQDIWNPHPKHTSGSEEYHSNTPSSRLSGPNVQKHPVFSDDAAVP